MTFARCLIASSLLLLPACASNPYYLVESELVESSRGYGAPDVTTTPAYRDVHDELHEVALRPPDVCADQGLAEGGGQEQLSAAVLRTRCGVEMSEFERALAQKGYAVISWSAIHHKAEREGIPPRRAAQELGVDVLLQVNALERTRVEPGRDARWERHYYHSSRDGDRGAPAKVAGARRDTFERLIDAEEERILQTRQGATINASAVLVSNGSTIWFYEATMLDAHGGEPVVSLLFFCRENQCEPYQEGEPRVSTAPSTGSIKAISFGGEAADQQQAVYRQLIRRLVTDLVERFASGGA